MEHLAATLSRIPGVIAVTLGGSRAGNRARADSDWDFGLYYRGTLDASHIRALGFTGHVVAPGEWGRLVNGGAWLTIEGRRVDLLYRDLGFVEHWIAEAAAGRYELDQVEGYVAGMATYVLAGELALGKVLVGALPRPDFPDALRRSAPLRWYGSGDFSLSIAETLALRADTVSCAGLLAKAAIATAQGRLAARGEWALNEKGIVSRAGLDEAAAILAALGQAPTELVPAVAEMRAALHT
ncbi:nucleotidyltransferase domain-containing protein [soil metagenome]